MWFKNLFWKDDVKFVPNQVDITDTSKLMSFDEAYEYLCEHNLWDLYEHHNDYVIRTCATKLKKYLGEATIKGSKTN